MLADRVITKSLKIQVQNLTRKVELADRAEVADTSAKRRTGLLKHTGLEPGEGLWIVPCESVHSFFMKFTIDVLYLDRKHRVKKIRPEMAPWRISGCLTAHSVLELPAGTITRTGTVRGDQLGDQEFELTSIRRCSLRMQRSITTSRPAARAFAAASSWITPSCIQIGARADADGGFHDLRHELRPAEDIDNIDRLR